MIEYRTPDTLPKAQPDILTQRSLGDLQERSAFNHTGQTGTQQMQSTSIGRSFSNSLISAASTGSTEKATLRTKASLPLLSRSPPKLRH